MRLMYDSVSPELIPADATMIAGYVSGEFEWSRADWDRFPHAVRIRVDVDGSEPWRADVADCERGDLTPAGAAQWCLKRQRERGWASAVYVGLENWAACKAACQAVRADRVAWWIASWDGRAVIPDGAVAHQYFSGESFDMSAVSPHWFPRSAPGWSVP